MHAIELPNFHPKDYISMFDHEHHSHVDLNRFISSENLRSSFPTSLICTNSSSVCTAKAIGINQQLTEWKDVRRIVDRVHHHVCDHAEFSDIRTLLQRIHLWNEQVQHYLSKVVGECSSCRTTSTPPPNRRVSISSLNKSFNDIVCIDHLFLGSVTVFHVMDFLHAIQPAKSSRQPPWKMPF